ncbi:hypothetical protein ACVWXM_009709 [Bradyrhizobium sp. GM7.3]
MRTSPNCGERFSHTGRRLRCRRGGSGVKHHLADSSLEEISVCGLHNWSGVAIVECEATACPASLNETPHAHTVAASRALSTKTKCYSMAQMLSTRSVIERLGQNLLNVGAEFQMATSVILP